MFHSFGMHRQELAPVLHRERLQQFQAQLERGDEGAGLIAFSKF
jgi:hypothetical protein